MAGKILKIISAGSKPVYEIVDIEGKIRIRPVENNEEYIDLNATVLPILIEMLQEVNKEINKK